MLFRCLVTCLASALAFVGCNNAIAQGSAEACKGLAPTDTRDVSESFKGKVEGRLGGLLGKLTGGIAGLEGEYKKLATDTLKDYPESHKLYVWQKIIYFACLDKNSGIDINELAKAYLIGPGMIDLSPKTAAADVEIKLAGVDSVSSIETLAIHGAPDVRGAMFPDLVFSFTNVSDKDVHVELDECSLVAFNYPKPIKSNASAGTARPIRSITGTALMKSVGPYTTIVRPRQKRMKSYGIFSIDAPSYEARRQSTSICRFRVGDGTISATTDVMITSQPQPVAQ